MQRFVVLAVVTVSTVLGISPDACTEKLCRCSGHMTEVNCADKNLTYVPKVPKTITNIHFIGNYLPNISADSLFNLSGLHIKNFEFRFDYIRTVEPNAFDGIQKLRIFDVSFNNLSTDSLYNLFTEQLHRNLKTMYLKSIGIKTIPSDICRSINTSSVTMIDLSFNQLTHFNFTAFKPLMKVSKIKLNNNKLSTFQPSYFPSLRNLDLFGNKISDLSWFCSNGDLFPKLNSINLRNNSIDNLKPKHFACLKKLATLDLSMNYISVLVPNSFQKLPSLQLLSINSQKNQKALQISARSFNNRQLKSLYLSNNVLRTDHVDSEAFSGCSGLTKLDLSSNAFYTNQQKMDEVLAPLKSLQVLNLYRSDLTRIPPVIGKLTKLQKLYLATNFITDWQDDQFFNNTDLVDLNLQSNGIQTIRMEMFPGYLKDRLKKIDLSRNAFVCNCGIVWFVQWMRSEPSKFLRYPKEYNCLKITQRACLKNNAVFISMTTVTCVFILILLATSIVYKNRWMIKYYIYMWRYRPIKIRNLTEKHFAYDVFVSYCIEDSDWVVCDLLPSMEEEQGLKLCIHERDFEGGKLIIDNIIHHMSNSRKVLFVLSNNFAKSEWCQYEVSLAMRLVLDMSVESLVVVLLEDVEAENMTRSLNALLKTTTYIAWSDDVEEQVLWTRLGESLKGQNLENIE